MSRCEKKADALAAADKAKNWTIWQEVDATSKDDRRYGVGHHAQYEWAVQRKSFIQNHSNDNTSAWSKEATAYLKLKAMVMKDANPGELEKIKAQLFGWDQVWTQRFFDQVDIVFVTNNSTAYPVLGLHYAPTVMVADEVAQAAIMDQATPAAAFKTSLKQVYFTGDHKQQILHMLVQSANENHPDISKSAFEMLTNNKSLREKIQLDEQYRMAPWHSKMVSKLWYEGTLVDAPHVLSAHPLDSILLQALEGLKPIWNRKLRLMVDVGGERVQSEVDPDTKITRNVYEAELILDHIEHLLSINQPPAEDGEPLPRKIQKSDILVISPYKGQVKYIKVGLVRRGINSAESNVEGVPVRSYTSAAVQGHQAPIVLFSMVRNTPGKPTDMDFVRRSQQLCVNMSRVQVYQATFGNVRASYRPRPMATKASTRVDSCTNSVKSFKTSMTRGISCPPGTLTCCTRPNRSRFVARVAKGERGKGQPRRCLTRHLDGAHVNRAGGTKALSKRGIRGWEVGFTSNVRPQPWFRTFSWLAKLAAKGHCVATSVGLGGSALPRHPTAQCSKGIVSSLAKPV